MSKEEIESIATVLFALHDQQQRISGEVKMALKKFHKDANMSNFVDIGDATPGKLAKLANFVSESVSSQSQALCTGSSSVALNF